MEPPEATLPHTEPLEATSPPMEPLVDQAQGPMELPEPLEPPLELLATPPLPLLMVPPACRDPAPGLLDTARLDNLDQLPPATNLPPAMDNLQPAPQELPDTRALTDNLPLEAEPPELDTRALTRALEEPEPPVELDPAQATLEAQFLRLRAQATPSRPRSTETD